MFVEVLRLASNESEIEGGYPIFHPCRRLHCQLGDVDGRIAMVVLVNGCNCNRPYIHQHPTKPYRDTYMYPPTAYKYRTVCQNASKHLTSQLGDT